MIRNIIIIVSLDQTLVAVVDRMHYHNEKKDINMIVYTTTIRVHMNKLIEAIEIAKEQSTIAK